MKAIKCKITYRIRTDYPKDTGFERKKYSVIGSWMDPRTHIAMTCGAISFYGCDNLREAKSMLKNYARENKFVLV